MKLIKQATIRVALACIISMLILTAAQARMYQWQQPKSGNIQLSGHAPAWYRSVNLGPRVLVFENGKLVDDTAVAVGEAHRLKLREAALGETIEVRASAAPALAPDEALRNTLTEAAKAGINVEELAAEANAAAIRDQLPPSNTIQSTVEELKALLNRWDEVKSQEARNLLNGAASEFADPHSN